MPLRLARYGVPLAETAAAGLAAADIDEPPIRFIVERTPVPAQRQSPELEAAVDQAQEPATVGGGEPQPMEPTRAARSEQTHVRDDEGNAQHLASAYQDWMTAFGSEPTSPQFALWLQDQYGIATAAGGPLPDEQLERLLKLLKERHTPSVDTGTDPRDDLNGLDDGWGDYFYNAWFTDAQEHGAYPDAATLATYVFGRDQITGGSGQRITGEDLAGFVAAFRQREFDEAEPTTNVEAADSVEPFPNADEPEQNPVGVGAHPAKGNRTSRVSAAIDDPPPGAEAAIEQRAVLTTVDRYYLALTEHQAEHSEEPTAEQLPPTSPRRTCTAGVPSRSAPPSCAGTSCPSASTTSGPSTGCATSSPQGTPSHKTAQPEASPPSTTSPSPPTTSLTTPPTSSAAGRPSYATTPTHSSRAATAYLAQPKPGTVDQAAQSQDT